MRLPRLAGAAVLSTLLLTATAFAATPKEAPPKELPKMEQQQLSPGEKEVLQELKELRRSHREKLKADSMSVLERAVKQGKITQEQADKLKARRHAKIHKLQGAELKERLDQAVKDGHISPERAEAIMEHHKEIEKHNDAAK